MNRRVPTRSLNQPMSTTDQTPTIPTHVAAKLTEGAWQLDPSRSSVEFHVCHFYGVMTVKGAFADYQGTLDLSATPAVELAIQAVTLDTKMAKRDEHLRSGDFFDVERHPQVRFASESATLDGDTLRVHGQLHAAGRQIPLDLDASMREIDGELKIEAVSYADHRELGMTWSPLGILRAPSKLIV